MTHESRVYFSSMTNQVHMAMPLAAFPVESQILFVQEVLRNFVLPQCRSTDGVTDPALDKALERVWTALNKAL